MHLLLRKNAKASVLCYFIVALVILAPALWRFVCPGLDESSVAQQHHDAAKQNVTSHENSSHHHNNKNSKGCCGFKSGAPAAILQDGSITVSRHDRGFSPLPVVQFTSSTMVDAIAYRTYPHYGGSDPSAAHIPLYRSFSRYLI
jgi:hypothetical protein